MSSMVRHILLLPHKGEVGISNQATPMHNIKLTGWSMIIEAACNLDEPRNQTKSRLKIWSVIIQSVTGPHRQNGRDDRPCREDHFLWRDMYSQTCRLWVMRRWKCSPIRVGIEYKQLYTYFIEKGMFLQYVFRQSALCFIACLISSQQRLANKDEQQVLLVQSTVVVVVAPKEKIKGR